MYASEAWAKMKAMLNRGLFIGDVPKVNRETMGEREEIGKYFCIHPDISIFSLQHHGSPILWNLCRAVHLRNEGNGIAPSTEGGKDANQKTLDVHGGDMVHGLSWIFPSGSN
jgi:hypothetical protein